MVQYEENHRLVLRSVDHDMMLVLRLAEDVPDLPLMLALSSDSAEAWRFLSKEDAKEICDWLTSELAIMDQEEEKD